MGDLPVFTVSELILIIQEGCSFFKRKSGKPIKKCNFNEISAICEECGSLLKKYLNGNFIACGDIIGAEMADRKPKGVALDGIGL